MARREADQTLSPTVVEVPSEVGKPLWQAARAARAADAPIFTCSITLHEVRNSSMKLSTKPQKSTEYSPDRLLAAIEALGWTLNFVDHVWVPAASYQAGSASLNTTGHSGFVQGRYLFRAA